MNCTKPTERVKLILRGNNFSVTAHKNIDNITLYFIYRDGHSGWSWRGQSLNKCIKWLFKWDGLQLEDCIKLTRLKNEMGKL